MERTTPPDPPSFNERPSADEGGCLAGPLDPIAERPDEISVLESHLALAEERLAAYRRDPSRARPAHDVLDELANR